VYLTLLFLHILSVVMLTAGTTLGAITSALAKRWTGTRELATVATFAQRVPALTIPGSLLAMITGSLLVWKMGLGFGTPWIVASYALWTLAFVLSGAILGRKMRAAAPLLQTAIESGAPEAPEFQKALLDPTFRMTQRFLEALILVFVYLMVFKPGVGG
jgi:uncharacterized membrane protein